MSSVQPHTGYDARSLTDRIRNTLWRRGKTIRQKLLPHPLELHVFVAGMQRSGTNLLMDILDASIETRVFHETDPSAFDLYQMRDEAVIRELAGQCRARVFVIKALCELDRFPDLMYDFAPAKTLWMVRDWRDSAHSAVKSFGNFVQQWERLTEGDPVNWRGRGMSEITRSVLAELYRPDASEAEGAAIMWYYRNALFFERQLHTDDRVCLVFYEDMVEHPRQEVELIFGFIGLNDSPRRIARRIYAHSVRHREPEGVSTAVSELCDSLLARLRAHAACPLP